MLRNNNHRAKDYLRTDRVVKRKRKRTTRKLILILILLALVIAGLVFVARLDALEVKKINIQGNTEVSSADMIDIANEYASSSWLYFFPRKNVAFYPVEKIESELKTRFPKLSDVSVRRTGIDSVEIQVIERKPRALWCDDANQCYTVDDQGYIYAVAPAEDTASSTDLIHFSGGLSAESNPIGTNINSSSTFSDIASLLQGMKERGLTPEQVQIRNNHEFSVRVNTGGNVIFTDIRPLSESLENLTAALQSAAFKGTSTAQNFEYIDTRFGNKIFFKMQK